jgi:DHA1 family bicyclomycin/chloramphenicol resistance-like MFS transporter
VIAPTRTPPHLGTMILLVGLVVLTLNMFLPALPRMATWILA